MPKFTEQEKVEIRKNLLYKGRELFIQNGLSKTSIDDIVHACKIGKGTFYKFFSSKEELYFEVLKNEEEVRETVLLQLYKENLSPVQLIKSFFYTSFEFVEKNPFLQRALQNEEHELLLRKLPNEMRAFSEYNTNRGILAIQSLIESNVLPDKDPKIIVGIFQAIMMLRLHKKEIGEELFSDVMEEIISFVAKGLTKE